jgi:FKBP-type peptidyl-prolyl cis-trans isomerase 2
MLNKKITEVLDTLGTHGEITEAWDYLKQRWTMLSMQDVMKFHVGQEVKWESRKRSGLTLQGVIKKINQTTVSVDVKDAAGQVVHWKVAPSYLSAV